MTVTYGAAVGELPKPVREGFRFSGWYLEDGTRITENTVYSIEGDSTLYAKWVDAEGPPATADNSMSTMLLALAGMTALAACALVFGRKRRMQN